MLMVGSAALAEALGSTLEDVRALDRRGVIRRTQPGGKYDADTELPRARYHLRTGLIPPDDWDPTAEAAPDESLADAKARLERAKADKMELDVARRRGELIPAVDVAERVGAMAGMVRAEVMSWPSSLAPSLAACGGDVGAVRATLDGATRELCRRLAQALRDFASDPGRLDRERLSTAPDASADTERGGDDAA